jgi:hypothetical protein
MDKNQDYLKDSRWYRDVIDDPYQVIARFFDYIDIASCRKRIKHLLLAAGSDNKVYQKESPGAILDFFRMFESVINAAYIINKEKKESPLIIGVLDLFNKNLYCGRSDRISQWDYLPRFLSEKEFCNPYLVFRRFFKTNDIGSLKEILGEILNCATTRSSICEWVAEVNLISCYIYLNKVLEAVHLIDVRENVHINGRMKNR